MKRPSPAAIVLALLALLAWWFMRPKPAAEPVTAPPAAAPAAGTK